jgi:hypothetical protein
MIRRSGLRSTGWLALAILASLTLASCASSYRRDGNADSAARAGTGPTDAGTMNDPSRAGAHSVAAGSNAAAVDSGVVSGPTECRGPGRYEAGKEGSYRPCCAGLREVLYKKAAYGTDPSGQDIPICADFPERVYACVRGTCGDGICEEGESPACGCLADCPNAAWEHPPEPLDDAGSAVDANELIGQPKTCGKVDLVAQLQTSPHAIDCGDLPVDASSDAKTAARQCARDAVASAKPFQLFWLTSDTGTLNRNGLVARLEGGVLRTYSVSFFVGNSSSAGSTSESASWMECYAFGSSSCTATTQPDECFRCTSRNDTLCMCAPPLDLEGSPAGGPVAVSCVVILD